VPPWAPGVGTPR